MSGTKTTLAARFTGMTALVVGALLMNILHASRIQAFTGITNDSVGDLGSNADAAMSGATFVDYFIYLWNALMVVGGLIVLFFFIQAAIEWITAGGDSGKIQKARDRMIQSTIGLFILVTSFIIVNYISSLLFGGNFNILNLTLPDPNAAPRWQPPSTTI